MIDEKKLIDELENWSKLDKEMSEIVMLVIDTFKKMIEKQPKIDVWIPVEKELPEDGKTVLCWYEYFRFGNYNRIYQDYGIGWQCRGFWGGISGVDIKVLAWMPLPEPCGGNEDV